MKFSDFLWGSGSKGKKQKALTKEGQEAQRRILAGEGIEQDPLYQQGASWLQRLLAGDMSAFEQPYIEQFEQETAPGIAERFAGYGAMGSSGLNQALAQAGKSLQMQLAGQRANLMSNMMPQVLNYAQTPYNQQIQAMGISPYHWTQQQGQEGFVPGMVRGGTQAAMGGIGQYANAYGQRMGGVSGGAF